MHTSHNPTEQATLDALRSGPGDVHELRERTGRSRSATDKAIAALAKADLITKVDGGDPADGAPARWQLADPTPPDGNPTPHNADPHPGPVTGGADTDINDASTADGPVGPDSSVDSDGRDDQAPQEPGSSTDSDGPTGSDVASPTRQDHNAQLSPDGPPEATTDGRDQADGQGEGEGDGEQTTAVADEVKTCRGCQAQMPKLCACCWQKTPAYCGTCRRTMPQVRRGEPGEPLILSNGLPKLRPGELEHLVLQIMRDNPVPHHVGVTGWTGGRVAIFLPGRSTGAINNALEKLTRTGTAELVGDRPMRYRLVAEQQPEDGAGEADLPDGPAGPTS